MNEAKKTLTMEFIESIMDENYTLVWVDYRESFDENRDLLQKCLEKQGCEDLWSKVEDWYEDTEEQATQEIIKGLKSHCIDFHDFEEDEVEAFFEEHDDEIRDEIRERDDSTTVNDLVKNTRDIPVRVEMLSNYDCINSCWLESQGGFCQCRATDGEEEGLCRIGQELQVVTALGSELGSRNGCTTIVVVLEQIFCTHHPAVSLLGISRHRYSRVVVKRRFRAVDKATSEFHTLHLREITLGVCLP